MATNKIAYLALLLLVGCTLEQSADTSGNSNTDRDANNPPGTTIDNDAGDTTETDAANIVPSDIVTGSLDPGDDSLLIPAEGGAGPDFNDGASFFFWNKAAQLRWQNEGGDYLDASGIVQGPTPWAVTTVRDIDSVHDVSWNITALVTGWTAGALPNRGLLLQAVGGSSGPLDYYSDEWPEPDQRPSLSVAYVPRGTTDQVTVTLSAGVDTTLNSSSLTVTMGQSEQLRVGNGEQNVILWFDLSALEGADILSASLKLTSYAQFTNSDVDHGLFALTTAQFDTSAPVTGLAAAYPEDVGLSADPDVYFQYSFDSVASDDGGDWLDPNSATDPLRNANRWPCKELSPAGRGRDGKPLAPQPGFAGYRVAPIAGEALCLRLAYEDGAANTQGLGNYGVSLERLVVDFPAGTITQGQSQVEELYVRLYIYLGDTWGENINNEAGKRPGGISGRQQASEYAAGWGGRRTDGTNGWSARGGYFPQVPYGYNPLEGFTMLSSYIYHADMQGSYGDGLPWAISPNGLLQKGRWYSLEQQVSMNTRDGGVGVGDGVIRGWVDGRLVFERTGLRFTDMEFIGIDAAAFGLYYGGPGNTPHDQNMAIDNIVVAKSYIGPMVAGD